MKLRFSSRLRGRQGPSSRERGQSLVEFALIVPIMFVMVVAIADFGRVFGALSATESAAREAADYGAFIGSAKWASSLAPWSDNVTEMNRRAFAAMAQQSDYCDAAKQAQLTAQGQPACALNPVVTWQLMSWDRNTNTYADVTGNPAYDCGPRIGLLDPCVVHVTVTYNFRPMIPLPQLISLLRPGGGGGGDTLTLTRDSWFAMSDLTGS